MLKLLLLLLYQCVHAGALVLLAAILNTAESPCSSRRCQNTPLRTFYIAALVVRASEYVRRGHISRPSARAQDNTTRRVHIERLDRWLTIIPTESPLC